MTHAIQSQRAAEILRSSESCIDMSASGCVLAEHLGAAGALHFGIFLANSRFTSQAVGCRWRDIPLESMQSHRVLPTGIKGPTVTGTSPNSCMCSISGAARHAWICATALVRHARATRRDWTLQSSCIMRQSEGGSNRCAAAETWLVVAIRCLNFCTYLS